MNNKFIDRIQKELDKKIVGEEKLRMEILLHMMKSLVKNRHGTSYALVNGKSSSGKSYITKKVFDLLPWSEKNTKIKIFYRTRISPTAIGRHMAVLCKGGYVPSLDNYLFYLEDISQSLLDSDILKVMGSEGINETITINGKAVEIRTTGIPVLIMTTASGVPSKEMTNRMSIMKTNDSEEQTNKIIKRYLNPMKQEYDKGLRTELAELKRVRVEVPFQNELINLPMLKSVKIELRRDLPRFVDYIKASAALNQKHREHKTINGVECVIASEEDKNIALYVYSDRQTTTVVEDEILNSMKTNSGLTVKELIEYHNEIGLTRLYKVLYSLEDKGFIKREKGLNGLIWLII